MNILHDNLNKRNFLIYAARNYDNPTCHSTDEFMEDLRRIKYLKKLITRYISTGELKERLILNHVIILSNVFKPEPLCRLLWLRLGTQFKYLKPFLIKIGVLTDFILNVDEDKKIETDNIPMDWTIVETLRKI